MTDSEPPRPLPRVKGRLPFEPNPFGGATQRGAVIVYGLVTLGLLGLALYNGLIERLAITSGYVAGPAIGAAWFGLRLFLMIAPKGPK